MKETPMNMLILSSIAAQKIYQSVLPCGIELSSSNQSLVLTQMVSKTPFALYKSMGQDRVWDTKSKKMILSLDPLIKCYDDSKKSLRESLFERHGTSTTISKRLLMPASEFESQPAFVGIDIRKLFENERQQLLTCLKRDRDFFGISFHLVDYLLECSPIEACRLVDEYQWDFENVLNKEELDQHLKLGRDQMSLEMRSNPEPIMASPSQIDYSLIHDGDPLLKSRAASHRDGVLLGDVLEVFVKLYGGEKDGINTRFHGKRRSLCELLLEAVKGYALLMDNQESRDDHDVKVKVMKSEIYKLFDLVAQEVKIMFLNDSMEKDVQSFISPPLKNKDGSDVKD